MSCTVKNWLFLLAAVMCQSWHGCPAPAAVVDQSWTIYAGRSDLVRTAARDLRDLLGSECGIRLAGPAPLESGADVEHGIIIGTIDDNEAIAVANRANPFRVDPGQPEGYHLQVREGRVYVVGSTPKGAMNGAFRLLDRITARGLDVGTLDEARAPVFRHRVGGHRMNQAPPPDWSEEQQARYYARHYFNVVWGEKHGPPMSLEARQKYGLGLMVEIRLPPQFERSHDWMNGAEFASAVYYHKGSEGRRVLDPFDPVGRAMYLKAYRELLEKNPDTKILYALFGDYSVIPSPASRRVSDGQAYSHTRVETMQQVMGILREAIEGGPANDAVAVAWLWHGFFGEPPQTEQQFMTWLRDNGYGMLYNEAGNNDNWLIKRDNFAETALRIGDAGRVFWGDNYYPLVSIGGACESVNPVIAMPLPMVAAHKTKRLLDARVNNVVFWWGSAEGWTYSANNEVFARAVWEPEALNDVDALLNEVAARDFGKDLAGEIVNYWKSFDQALVTDGPLYQPVDKQPPPDQDGLHINDWYQRMGIFTETVFSQAFAKPLTPESLADHEPAKKGTYWGTHDKTLANYAHVLRGLDSAQAKLRSILSRPMGDQAKRRTEQMYRWSELYRTLLRSQNNYLRALRAVHGRADDPVKPEQVKQRLSPVIKDELANVDEMIAVLEQLPANTNIRQPHEGVVSNRGSTAQEIASLRDKATAMKFAEIGLPNVARGATATASSEKTEGGTHFAAAGAVDGDMATRWASTFRDQEWLSVDLGQVRQIEFIRIHWKNAYPAEFELQVSDEATPTGWRSIHRAGDAGGGVTVIPLSQPVPARHVRFYGLKQATAWGYSVQEFEVFGK